MTQQLLPSDSPIYGNCLVRGPSGDAIFRCDDSKMDWYLRKGLAKRIAEDPPQIQLLFQPSGHGHMGDPFFLEARKSACVVCGTTRDLTRHHVLPHQYRRWFPRDLDRYGTYDVMALCVEHHASYEERSRWLSRKIAEEYDAPSSGIGGNADPRIARGIRAAFALLRHRAEMPLWRSLELESTIIEIFDCSYDITDELLRELVGRFRRTMGVDKTHGRLVVEQIDGHEALGQFVIRWRKHFLKVMRPRFLPKYWKADRVFQPE